MNQGYPHSDREAIPSMGLHFFYSNNSIILGSIFIKLSIRPDSKYLPVPDIVTISAIEASVGYLPYSVYGNLFPAPLMSPSHPHQAIIPN
jgi:hypothetical protein